MQCVQLFPCEEIIACARKHRNLIEWSAKHVNNMISYTPCTYSEWCKFSIEKTPYELSKVTIYAFIGVIYLNFIRINLFSFLDLSIVAILVLTQGIFMTLVMIDQFVNIYTGQSIATTMKKYYKRRNKTWKKGCKYIKNIYLCLIYIVVTFAIKILLVYIVIHIRKSDTII